MKRGHLDTGMHVGRTPCEDEGRGQGNVSFSQEHHRLPADPPKWGKRHSTRPPTQASEGTPPADTLISASKLGDNKFLFLKPPHLDTLLPKQAALLKMNTEAKTRNTDLGVFKQTLRKAAPKPAEGHSNREACSPLSDSWSSTKEKCVSRGLVSWLHHASHPHDPLWAGTKNRTATPLTSLTCGSLSRQKTSRLLN